MNNNINDLCSVLNLNTLFGFDRAMHFILALPSIRIILLSPSPMTWCPSVTNVIWAIYISSVIFSTYFTPIVLYYRYHYLHEPTSLTYCTPSILIWVSIIVNFKCRLLLIGWRTINDLIQVAIQVILLLLLSQFACCFCFY